MKRLLLGLVWNEAERRLRMPLRLLLGVAVFAVVGLAASAALRALTGGVVGRLLSASLTVGASSAAAQATSQLLGTAVTALGVYLAGRTLDRRSFADFGFHLDREWWADLAFGLALGAGLMTLVFLAELAVGWVRVTGTLASPADAAFLPWLLASLALFVGVGITEELLVRGYLLTNLAEGLRIGPVTPRAAVAVATLVTSVLFGVAHLANPNATAVSTASISLAGVMLALGYLLTGNLAIPIGLHITWNFFQGPVYGFPVSGLDAGVSVLAVRQSGPTTWTGGPFGPEAGVVGIAAMLLGSALTVAWARWRRGSVALDPDVWTPELRWRDRDRDRD